MLSTAQQFAARAPWAAVLPGLAIMVLALSFNVFGDSLRDALDPKASRR
jgi:peptide/nickel transport system permease protein